MQASSLSLCWRWWSRAFSVAGFHKATHISPTTLNPVLKLYKQHFYKKHTEAETAEKQTFPPRIVLKNELASCRQRKKAIASSIFQRRLLFQLSWLQFSLSAPVRQHLPASLISVCGNQEARLTRPAPFESGLIHIF